MVELDFDNKTSASIDQNNLKKHLESILRRLGFVDMVNIEISLVGDKDIQNLNAQHRQVDEPTDVLSFENPLFEKNTAQPLGSLIISTETATRQATEAGISLNQEVNMLAGHGLLHLLGYHHN